PRWGCDRGRGSGSGLNDCWHDIFLGIKCLSLISLEMITA
ncbi:MAG: hypothetical protein ACI9UA_005900, partial [Pseudoalteromonas tetraodonis]